MSEQLILGIIAAIVTLTSAILGAIVAIQNQKLTHQGQEQERQKATITRLADEAKERQAARLAEREADRLDKEARQKEYEFWRNAHKELSDEFKALQKDKTDEHGSYVALATKHDEFRRDYDSTKIKLDDVTKLSERQAQELIHLKDEQEKALNTIASMHQAHLDADRLHINEIQLLNDDAARKQEALQKQIDRVTDDLRRANEEIVKLQRRVAEVEDTNMTLAEQNRKQDEQIVRLIAEKAALLAEKAALQAELDALKNGKPQPPTPILEINADTGETERKNAA